MRPVHHTVLSAVAAVAVLPFLDLPPLLAVIAALIGIAAGVLVDVDHVILPSLHRRDLYAFRWMRRPVAAFREPGSLLADVEYDRMVLHRLLSHSTVLVAFYLASTEFPVLAPAVAALAVHILADVVWDVYNGSYRDQLP